MWRRPWPRAGLLCALVVCGWANAVQALPPKTSVYHYEARSYSYLPATDDFKHYKSAVAYHPPRPGGPLAYYGNRLTQYRYIGNSGEGGYYDAWNDYVHTRRLDPQKYQYRVRTR